MRKNHLILISFLLFLQLPHILFATSDYQEGYYVNAEGDTIRGFILFEAGFDNYSLCRFKATEEAVPRVLKPSQIQAYNVAEKRLFRTKNTQINGVSVPAFFEVLILGELSLYKHKDDFFLERNENLDRIYVKRAKVQKNGSVFVEESREHILLFVDAFVGCEALRREISTGARTPLIKEKALIKLVEEYYYCAGKSYKVYKQLSMSDEKLAWKKLKFGVFVGSQYSAVKFENLGLGDFLKGFDYGVPLSGKVGLTLDFSFPRINERLSLLVEAVFQKNLIQGFGEEMDNDQLIYQEIKLKFQEVSIPLGIKYVMRPQWNDFFLSIGISQQMYFKQEFFSLTDVVSLEDKIVSSFEQRINRITKFQTGIWVGTGLFLVQKPNFSIPLQLRFQNKGNVIKSDLVLDPFSFYLNSQYRSVSLLMGVQF